MSRLYDRVLANGCEPLSARRVLGASYETEEWRPAIADVLEEELGRMPSAEEVSERLVGVFTDAQRSVSSDTYEPEQLDGATVLSAEEVADYWATLPEGTNVLDLFDVLVPPFDRLFVEFQHRPNSLGLESWGLLVGTVRMEVEKATTVEPSEPVDFRTDGWVLGASLIGEWRKGRPVGPIARWIVPLDEQGRPKPGGIDGLGSLFAFPLDLPNMPEDDAYRFTNALGPSHLGPALFAISLMHCKNVDLRAVDPPDRLSRRHERKTGHPLTRYHVLDIQPMRRILDREGEAQTRGLTHALHICRGHFKTFADDAPLFGRHAGTYWWPAHARGKAEEGTVEKDYRIRLDAAPLGRDYVPADELPEITPNAAEHTGLDPDLGGRGLRAHAVTQNLLASFVEQAGLSPRSPKPNEPQFDTAWEAGDVVWVAEVKSITPQNEERQLRLALGQVVRYRQLLAAEGREVKAMIVAEREPSDPSWASLCEDEGIVLAWPGNLNVTGR